MIEPVKALLNQLAIGSICFKDKLECSFTGIIDSDCFSLTCWRRLSGLPEKWSHSTHNQILKHKQTFLRAVDFGRPAIVADVFSSVRLATVLLVSASKANAVVAQAALVFFD